MISVSLDQVRALLINTLRVLEEYRRIAESMVDQRCFLIYMVVGVADSFKAVSGECDSRIWSYPHVAAAIVGTLERSVRFELVVGPILAIKDEPPNLDAFTYPTAHLIKRINITRKKISIYLTFPGDPELVLNNPYLNAAILSAEERGVEVSYIFGPPLTLIDSDDDVLPTFFGNNMRNATTEEASQLLNT